MHVEAHPSISPITVDAIRFCSHHRSSQSKGLPNVLGLNRFDGRQLQIDQRKLHKCNKVCG